MNAKNRVRQLLQGKSRSVDVIPSHVCQTCEKIYFGDPATEIDVCRRCGGVQVEKA